MSEITVEISPAIEAQRVTVTEDEVRRVIRVLDASGFCVYLATECEQAGVDELLLLSDAVCCEDGILTTLRQKSLSVKLDEVKTRN